MRRAINQAMGRVIRHRHDYGAIILADERFRGEATRKQISCWLRDFVKPQENFGAASNSLKAFFKVRGKEFSWEDLQSASHKESLFAGGVSDSGPCRLLCVPASLLAAFLLYPWYKPSHGACIVHGQTTGMLRVLCIPCAGAVKHAGRQRAGGSAAGASRCLWRRRGGCSLVRQAAGSPAGETVGNRSIVDAVANDTKLGSLLCGNAPVRTRARRCENPRIVMYRVWSSNHLSCALQVPAAMDTTGLGCIMSVFGRPAHDPLNAGEPPCCTRWHMTSEAP